jgi:hypothetical protein
MKRYALTLIVAALAAPAAQAQSGMEYMTNPMMGMMNPMMGMMNPATMMNPMMGMANPAMMMNPATMGMMTAPTGMMNPATMMPMPQPMPLPGYGAPAYGMPPMPGGQATFGPAFPSAPMPPQRVAPPPQTTNMFDPAAWMQMFPNSTPPAPAQAPQPAPAGK